MEFNLADLFESVVDVCAESTAIVAGPRRLTYAQLDDRANRLAHHLACSGVGPGDRVGLQLVNGCEYLESMLACFKVRAVPVNVNYRYVAVELRHLFSDAGLVGLVVHQRFAASATAALDGMDEHRSVLCVAEPEDAPGGEGGPHLGDDYEEALAAARGGRDFPTRSAGDLYCVYTGGTTGMPKGVLWRHEDIFFAAMGGGDPMSLGNVITEPEQLAERVLRPGIVALAIPPFMHASGHWLAFSNMFGGGTVVTLPHGNFDPAEVWRLVEAERVNAIVLVGDAMARPLLDALVEDQGRATCPLCWRSARAVRCSHPPPRCVSPSSCPGGSRPTCSGLLRLARWVGSSWPTIPSAHRACGSTNRQRSGRPLRPVRPGWTWLGTWPAAATCPSGTWVTRRSLRHLREGEGRRWSLPGDMATVDADGVIVLLGRGTLSINTGGEKVFPDEVEAVLKGHSDVLDAVVVGVPDDRFGQQVCAVVQFRRGHGASLAALQEYCRGLLTDFKIPRRVVVAESIVRSPSGKADYPWAAAYAKEATPIDGGSSRTS